MTGAAPGHLTELAERRAAARAAGDFATADALREQIADAGWTVVDDAAGWQLVPILPEDAAPPGPVRAAAVPSVLHEPATADVSVHWVVEGWPEDVARGIASFRAHRGDRDVRHVVADVTGADAHAFGDGVEVVALESGTGWGAACNAGLRRARGNLVFVMDGSIEVAGDVFTPLARALEDPGVGLAGPFGIVTHDLRQFDDVSGPGDCDAVEGYFMAMRREVLTSVGLFDEKFKWYRTADIEFSFRVKDHGLRTVVMPVPVKKHSHRMWFETPPADRAKWSKRNFYRFLDRWRDRWDLVLDPQPPE
jgi:Glycosyl transferase family 2/Glycosyltransferase like family 2